MRTGVTETAKRARLERIVRPSLLEYSRLDNVARHDCGLLREHGTQTGGSRVEAGAKRKAEAEQAPACERRRCVDCHSSPMPDDQVTRSTSRLDADAPSLLGLTPELSRTAKRCRLE